MNLMQKSLTRLEPRVSNHSVQVLEKLPREIDFFGEGQLTLSKSPSSLSALGASELFYRYDFHNDGIACGCLIIGVEKTLRNENEIFAEIGNIVAGRLASTLSREENSNYLISSPKKLDLDSKYDAIFVEGLKNSHTPIPCAKFYTFKAGNLKINLHISYFVSASGVA